MEQQQISALGYWGVASTITLVVIDYDNSFDRVKTIFLVDSEYRWESKRTTKTHWTTSGRGYIVRYGTRYYLDECMRTDF